MGSRSHGNRSSIGHDLAQNADDVLCIYYFFVLLCAPITLSMLQLLYKELFPFWML